jgi:hypothetical protein
MGCPPAGWVLDRAHNVVEVEGDLLARERLDLDRATLYHHVDLRRDIDTGDVHIVQLDIGNAMPLSFSASAATSAGILPCIDALQTPGT